MCGIAGFIGQTDAFVDKASNWLPAASHAIRHRGPDSNGIDIRPLHKLGLAHQRLAILDLSEAGHQPMHSTDAAWTIVFNGDIYTHVDLRKSLTAANPGINWRGHSDTETLLAGFAHWGFEATLKQAVGMFAIAAWHQPTETLFLARDRFGEKPLYYAPIAGQGLAFASELKALRTQQFITSNINTEALAHYLQTLYVPAPLSIYNGMFKLPPAHILRIQRSATGQLNISEPVAYWSYADTVTNGISNPITDELAALHELKEVLQQAVNQQCLADVPLGAFLSGGVDSSLIAALMQSSSNRPIDTFTVGFELPDYDESAHAKAVAEHLGTRHHELCVTAQDAMDVIPQLSQMYCEPFADSSQIPTHLVCRAARQHATVALSGDAGDEMFGGYNRYLWGQRVWNKIGPLGRSGRNIGGWAIQSLSPAAWDTIAGIRGSSSNTGNAGVARVGEKLHKLASRMRNCNDIDHFYANLTSEWLNPAELLKGNNIKAQAINAVPLAIANDPIARMMYRDAINYLPGDILTKVDRAAMAISLETRAPFLDHRVAELAWRLPPHLKIRNGTGKWALRQILYKHVPASLIERPKSGFAIPLAHWLRGPLKAWAQDLLGEVTADRHGLLQPAPIQQAWDRHQSAKYDHSAKLWAILMLLSWQRSQ